MLENFAVGQNIAYKEKQCWGALKCPHNKIPDWDYVIKLFYEEVDNFNKNYVKSMRFVSGKEYGHFTQVSEIIFILHMTISFLISA